MERRSSWRACTARLALASSRHRVRDRRLLAFEPDHLAAVATLMTGERTSARAAWLGACRGLGHTLTLLAAGSALVVWRAEMPATAVFVLAVVLMLVLASIALACY